MSEPGRTVETEPPTARAHASRWPGLVWALPLAALLVVAYLGLRALSDRGVDVVVVFPSAAGAKIGDTKVIYQGLEAGRVTRINLDPDGRRVDMTLRMIPRARAILNSHTKFWLVGAKPSLTDIESVKAALAGVTIGVSPGVGGAPTRRFVGLEDAPVVDPQTKGTGYELITHVIGPVRAGSTVLYHGQEIGKIITTRFTGLNAFRLHVFIYQPYDGLIRPGAQFWTSSPLQVSLNGSGFSTNIAPANTVFSGAIDFDLPASATHAGVSPAGSTFILYRDRGAAQQHLDGPEVLYDLYFKGAAGDLADGAAVKMQGFQIGEVREVRLLFDSRTGEPYTQALAAIYANRLGANDPALPSAAADTGDGVRTATDGRLQSLLQRGYRAHLTQSPPLIGGRAISLDPGKAGAGRLGPVTALSPYPVIPSEVNGTDLDDLTSQADQILKKVNQIPIAAIGEDVRAITGRLRALTGSPALSDSLNHLDSTLTQVDQMMAEVKPQVGPLIGKLNQTADQLNGTVAAARGVLSGDGANQDASLPGAIQQLTEAARSIRSLTDYLGRHPEALVRGKVKETSR
jgi:paraquat-inducible protein B